MSLLWGQGGTGLLLPPSSRQGLDITVREGRGWLCILTQYECAWVMGVCLCVCALQVSVPGVCTCMPVYIGHAWSTRPMQTHLSGQSLWIWSTWAVELCM